MDSKPPKILLPNELGERCNAWAHEGVASRRFKNSVSCFGAESNLRLQAHAKMAECAFAYWAGLDVARAVSWGELPDGGGDVSWRGRIWDVKHTFDGGRFLLWSLAKNHLYDEKNFDALVLVRGHRPIFEITGWIPKRAFKRKRQVAGDGHLLKPGTWFVPLRDLLAISLDQTDWAQ